MKIRSSIPPVVGRYEIVKGGQMYYNFTAKPNLFHRIMTRLILGWIWSDHETS